MITTEKCAFLAEVEVIYKSKVNPSERRKICSSADSVNIFREVFKPEILEHHEEMIMLCLNRANKVLGWIKISAGGSPTTDARELMSII